MEIIQNCIKQNDLFSLLLNNEKQMIIAVNMNQSDSVCSILVNSNKKVFFSSKTKPF